MTDIITTNIAITKKDARALNVMMLEDGYESRSAFMRKLIRNEWERRKKREPISVVDAMELEEEAAQT